jgi:hypothetical protein
MKKIMITGMVLGALLLSCGKKQLLDGHKGEYFYYDSLLDVHIEQVIPQVTLIEKTVQVDGVIQDNFTFVPDEGDIKQEVNVAYEIDPNHPDYKGMFEVDTIFHRLGIEYILNLKEGSNLALKEFNMTQYSSGIMDEIKARLERNEDGKKTEKWVFVEFFENRLDKIQTIETITTDSDSTHRSQTILLGFK